MTRYLHQRTLFGPLIPSPPGPGLGMVVVIPAKDEDAHLLASLESLASCHPPACEVEVIVVVNTGEDDSAACVARNDGLAASAREWAAHRSLAPCRFHIVRATELPRKHSGVGLARKIGMDEACRRLESSRSPRGVIACFDADSTCEENYLIEVEKLFRERPKSQACSIYFEHPLEGEEYPAEIYDAITHYELHLRYFIHAQRYAGFPFATQTIGSSMAVRCDAYQEQNGMNRRKAGEDFYFLHKFTPLGRVEELTTTRVVPSPRISRRVPFGTGKAVSDILDANGAYRTYAPQTFLELKTLFDSVTAIYEPDSANGKNPWDVSALPADMREFLRQLDFSNHIREIRANSGTLQNFRTRFFRWFNAFQIMKFAHLSRDRSHPEVEIVEAARWLLAKERRSEPGALEHRDARRLLEAFRQADRRGN